MKLVGILHQPRISGSEPLSLEIAQWLEERGVRSWHGSALEENQIDGNAADLDLLIVLGGDGSTLTAARMIAPYDVPIFGINLGRVGFLSEAQPGEWREKLTHVLQGEFWIERRLRLQAFLHRNDEVLDTFIALNEVVVGRGQQARVIHLHLLVDGDLVTTYSSDALIVSTPTGSTAYAMAAGGPLLPPQLQNFVVLPVAAHLSLNRALVLHEEAEISISVEMDNEANITADGQYVASLQNGDRIFIQKHDKPCLFARVDPPGYFYRRLMRRLGFSWPIR
jgi:NAD+ kinase